MQKPEKPQKNVLAFTGRVWTNPANYSANFSKESGQCQINTFSSISSAAVLS